MFGDEGHPYTQLMPKIPPVSQQFFNIDMCNKTYLFAVCAPGYGGFGFGTCSKCRKGFYKERTLYSLCTKCPDGTTTTGTGSTKATDCGKTLMYWLEGQYETCHM